MLRQLDERNGDGIVVQLLWDDSARPGSDVLVDYRDERGGDSYTLHASRDCALDVLHHPNVYASDADGITARTEHRR